MDKLSYDILHYITRFAQGHANAVTKSEIAYMLDTDPRTVQYVVNELRRNGEPIASATSNPPGYYWPVTDDEKKNCINSLWSRVAHQAQTARALERRFDMEPEGRQAVLELMKGA